MKIGERLLVLSNYAEATFESIDVVIKHVINSEDSELNAVLRPTKKSGPELKRERDAIVRTHDRFKAEKAHIMERLQANGFDFNEDYEVPENYLL